MVRRNTYLGGIGATLIVVIVLFVLGRPTSSTPTTAFHVEEATISELHRAIRERRTTCQAVVQQYIDRAKAFNGVCTALVTKDGAPVPGAKGIVRAGSPLPF